MRFNKRDVVIIGLNIKGYSIKKRFYDNYFIIRYFLDDYYSLRNFARLDSNLLKKGISFSMNGQVDENVQVPWSCMNSYEGYSNSVMAILRKIFFLLFFLSFCFQNIWLNLIRLRKIFGSTFLEISIFYNNSYCSSYSYFSLNKKIA